jgi:nitroreductase
MTNPIISTIEQRSTTSLYDASKDISDAQVTELARLATLAPSAFNLQNWRLIAVRSADAKARLRAVAWDQPKITDAAVTYIVCGVIAEHSVMPDRLAPVVAAGIMPQDMVPGWTGAAKSLYFEQPQRARDEAVRSATFSAMTLILAATSLGLGSTPMIGFDPEGVSREFGLAENEVPALLLAVGYATSENWPQKPRRPLSDVLEVF